MCVCDVVSFHFPRDVGESDWSSILNSLKDSIFPVITGIFCVDPKNSAKELPYLAASFCQQVGIYKPCKPHFAGIKTTFITNYQLSKCGFPGCLFRLSRTIGCHRPVGLSLVCQGPDLSDYSEFSSRGFCKERLAGGRSDPRGDMAVGQKRVPKMESL